jgi:hypothetical protein
VDPPGSQVSGALKSRTTNKNFQLGAKLYRMDEHGHGSLGDGGEIIGDVLLTGVEGPYPECSLQALSTF